jgi:hypothetical protein
MSFDFEECARRQSIRPVPAQWRGEILRAAGAQPAASPWWQEWLWPSPRAWAGLAAAWGVILLLTITAPDEGAASGRGATSARQAFAMLKEETAIIAQLSVSDESRPVPPPQPAAPQPRSSRRLKQSIG